MTTPILGITEMANSQVNQYVVANAAIRALESAGNDFLSVNLAGGNVALTAAQFAGYAVFRSSGNAIARDLTVIATKRLFVVQNGGSATLSVKLSTTTITIAAGEKSLLFTDGTAAGLIMLATSASASFAGGTLTGVLNEAPITTLASAATTDIGAQTSNTISVTGTTTITALGTIASGALRRVAFTGVLTLTHNATSLILPTGANITTAAGDVAEFVSLGAGNWRCVDYQRADGTALVGSGSFSGGTLTGALNEAPTVTIASAATVNIGAAAGNTISITGTTTITAFDTIAAGAKRSIVFAGALTLTHNATSLILPTGANITTAAGDAATFLSLGAGNWRCVQYQTASGAALAGGSGLTNFTEAVSTSAPNGTVPAVSLTASNAATNVDAVFKAKGTGSVLGQVPDNTATGGNKRGASAVDLQLLRTTNSQVASGQGAALVGGQNNTASGTFSSSVGGQTNTVSANYSFAGGGDSNTLSTGSRSGTLGGGSNSVTGTYSATVGGLSCTVSANYSFAGGRSNTASADYTFAHGYTCTADGKFSRAGGGQATARGVIGADVYAADMFSVQGDAQVRRLPIRLSTTTATPANLTSLVGTDDATTKLGMPSNGAMRIKGTVVARSTAGDVKTWDIVATFKNAAGTVSLLGSTVTVIDADAGASAWTIALSANNTNKTLDVQATGAAATTIRWVALLESVEVV